MITYDELIELMEDGVSASTIRLLDDIATGTRISNHDFASNHAADTAMEARLQEDERWVALFDEIYPINKRSFDVMAEVKKAVQS